MQFPSAPHKTDTKLRIEFESTNIFVDSYLFRSFESAKTTNLMSSIFTFQQSNLGGPIKQLGKDSDLNHVNKQDRPSFASTKQSVCQEFF